MTGGITSCYMSTYRLVTGKMDELASDMQMKHESYVGVLRTQTATAYLYRKNWNANKFLLGGRTDMQSGHKIPLLCKKDTFAKIYLNTGH